MIRENRIVSLQPVNPQRGLTEDRFQELIHNYPQVLPVNDIEPGFGRLIPICRELPTRHGPVDNLLMTPEGNLVLVEAKLFRNPEARRKVVAQALDYAACLFELDYEGLESAVLRAKFGSDPRPQRLYDLFADCEEALEEPRFVDAVNANLARGRVLILVAGDGIRTETERLTGLLQSHAGAHFTFALVELALYSVPGNESLVVCPRTLGKTRMIDRGIVRISDDRKPIVALEHPIETQIQNSQSRRTISSEQFLEALGRIEPRAPDAIRTLLEQLDVLDVYEELRTRLLLKWDTPEERTVNVGLIHPTGKIGTRYVFLNAPIDICKEYIEELARAWGVGVNRSRDDEWFVAGPDGKAPNLSSVIDKLPLWPPIIEKFQQRVRQRAATTVPV